MNDTPETQFARSGDLNIAYQVVGEGPPDLVYEPDWGGTIEVQWEQPELARFLRRLGSLGRLVTLDTRGVGASDPLPVSQPSPLEESMDDILAVTDDVGASRVVLIAVGSGAPPCCVLAATHPDRVASLILINAYARFARAPDQPWGLPDSARDKMLEAIELGWGKGGAAEVFAPGRADDADFRGWWARYRRLSASPKRAVEGMRAVFEADVREVLPGIRCPTLVLHRIADQHVRVDHGRDLAARIPDAQYVELDGDAHFPWVGDTERIVAEIERFAGLQPAHATQERVLATVVFTDIVGSTERARDLGDERWRELLDEHDETVRRQLLRFDGREVKTTGDGFLATFDGPTRAVRWACAVRDAVRPLGLEVRAGVHTGECERRGDDLGGIAVHIGARVGAAAAPGEVLVTRTVVDLSAGSGIHFEARGGRELRGLGEWELYGARD